MNLDQAALIFIVEYYELLQNNRDEIPAVYADGARMVLTLKDKPPQKYQKDFQMVIPKGPRKIIECSGETIGDRLFIHVRSSLSRASTTDFVDEAFSCTVTDTSILINYHSIHVNPFLSKLEQLPPPPPKPVQKPQEKPQEKPKPPPPPPEEITNIRAFDPRLTVFVRNLPFKVPPSEFIRELERFGRVVKFAQERGKLLAQFETRAARSEATHANEFEWNGRTPRIGGMPQDFQWERK